MNRMKDRDGWIGDALETYEGRLIRYAVRILGDVERARDVVQDTFLKLCSADRSKVEDRLGPWLYTVCRNRALDVVRRENRMNSTSPAELEFFESRLPTPGQAAERTETEGQVANALEKLPPTQREVVLLKFQENLSYKEIGEITGKSVSHVGVLIHTALARVRETIKTEPGIAAQTGGANS